MSWVLSSPDSKYVAEVRFRLNRERLVVPKQCYGRIYVTRVKSFELLARMVAIPLLGVVVVLETGVNFEDRYLTEDPCFQGNRNQMQDLMFLKPWMREQVEKLDRPMDIIESFKRLVSGGSKGKKTSKGAA